MVQAEYKDKNQIVNILINSFDDNKSVNYIIKQDKKRKLRVKKLMEYSFDVCYSFGKVYLSDNRKGCALIVMPDKKETTARSVFLDLKLIFSCIGFANAKKVMKREVMIKKIQPALPMYYLWFIGVDPSLQGMGTGSTLLSEIIKMSESDKRLICLETSTIRNLSWYKNFGFTIYNELNLGYKLFFLKRETGQ